jgi:hypothetical protein
MPSRHQLSADVTVPRYSSLALGKGVLVNEDRVHRSRQITLYRRATICSHEQSQTNQHCAKAKQRNEPSQ